MELIADIFLIAGAIGAGFYCFVLSRRLTRFNDLERGVGGAVAVLSSQVDDLSKTLIAAQATSDGSNVALNDLTRRAETVAGRLELLMASMHDQPEAEPKSEAAMPDMPEPASVPDATPQTPVTGPMFVRHARTQNGAV